MGKDNNKFEFKWLKLTFVIFLMTFMPVMSSIGGLIESQVIVAPAEKAISFKTKQSSTVSTTCAAYFKGTSSVNDCRDGEVPLPAATWLFVLALVAFVGLSNKKKV